MPPQCAAVELGCLPGVDPEPPGPHPGVQSRWHHRHSAPSRTRTCNRPIRSRVRYPLRHAGQHEYPRPGSNRHVRCGTTVFETVASACFATGAWLGHQDLNLDLRGQNPTGCRLPHGPKGEAWLDCQDLNLKLRVQGPAGCQLPHSPTSGSSRPCTDVSRVSTERPCHWTIEPRRWPESNRLGLALQASGWPFTFSASTARERLATCRAGRGRRPSAPLSACRHLFRRLRLVVTVRGPAYRTPELMVRGVR